MENGRSRVMRANETTTEDVHWHRLRNRRFLELKFVRQAPVGDYFADFLCREKRIVVEVDGATRVESHVTWLVIGGGLRF